MTFICYPNCSTCAKARAWLNSNDIKYTERNIKEQNPTYEEIKLWHNLSGFELKKFFNTSGQSYRALNLKEKDKPFDKYKDAKKKIIITLDEKEKSNYD